MSPAIDQKGAFKRAFEEVVRRHGYQKKGGAWYLDQPETIAVLELQKSQYGDKYYVNASLWLLALGENRFPAERLCHIRSRMGALFPEQEPAIETITNLEKPMESDSRARRFGELLETELLPLMKSCGTLDELRGSAGQRFRKSSLVRVEARPFLFGDKSPNRRGAS